MSAEAVRVAGEADVPALVDMVVAEAREAEGVTLDREVVTAAVTAAFRDPALARYWVLDGPGAPAGAIAAVREWSDWKNAAYWWIQLVYLVPEARGRGLLARLVDRVKAEARADSAPELRLYVHRDNARALDPHGASADGVAPPRALRPRRGASAHARRHRPAQRRPRPGRVAGSRLPRDPHPRLAGAGGGGAPARARRRLARVRRRQPARTRLSAPLLQPRAPVLAGRSMFVAPDRAPLPELD